MAKQRRTFSTEFKRDAAGLVLDVPFISFTHRWRVKTTGFCLIFNPLPVVNHEKSGILAGFFMPFAFGWRYDCF